MKQEEIDNIFHVRYGNGELEYRNDCLKIKKSIKTLFDIDLSVAECAEFWIWRSNQYDASWLNVPNPPVLNSDITIYFEKFVKDFYNEEKDGNRN